jgi:hypothetical protein
MATYEQIGTDTPDGLLVGGKSTDKIGFYGVTPVVQPAAIATPNDLTTTIASVTAIAALLHNNGLSL